MNFTDLPTELQVFILRDIYSEISSISRILNKQIRKYCEISYLKKEYWYPISPKEFSYNLKLYKEKIGIIYVIGLPDYRHKNYDYRIELPFLRLIFDHDFFFVESNTIEDYMCTMNQGVKLKLKHKIMEPGLENIEEYKKTKLDEHFGSFKNMISRCNDCALINNLGFCEICYKKNSVSIDLKFCDSKFVYFIMKNRHPKYAKTAVINFVNNIFDEIVKHARIRGESTELKISYYYPYDEDILLPITMLLLIFDIEIKITEDYPNCEINYIKDLILEELNELDGEFYPGKPTIKILDKN